MSDSRPFCRGCGHDQVSPIDEYAYDDVWASVSRHVGLTPPMAMRESLTPAPTVRLYRCPECETDSFHPAMAGDSDFYAWLSTSDAYYEATRWEFRVVADLVDPGQSVIDVGCGPGGFIEMALTGGASVVGVDENPRARARVSQLGAQSFATTEEAAVEGPFDVVAAFQVVEHVEAADDFLRELAQLAHPDGEVFVSVPNRERLDAGELQGLDFPPHHLTRWSPRSLVEAGRRAGLEATGLCRERPHPSHYRGVLAERLADVPGVGRASDATARLLVNRYTTGWIRRLGLDRSVQGHGHTMLVKYRLAS